MYYNLDFNDEDLPPNIDPAFSANSYENTLGDASSGVYLYGRKFYFGFSASDLLQSTFNPSVEYSPNSNRLFTNYYAMGAYRFYTINKDWQLEPSFLLRKKNLHQAVVDLTSRIIYIDNTWSGFTYRTDGTLIFAFGFASGNMHFSYSYDHTIRGDIMQYTSGSHELGIAFRIKTLVNQRHIGFWGY